MEQKGTEDARNPEILRTIPVHTPVKCKVNTTNNRTGASLEGEGSSAAVSPGLRRREAYCLLVWVTHNVDTVSALDAKVPDYAWTEVIARDICTHRVLAPSNTFTVELLSDTEFLLFEGPQSRPGIMWENVMKYVRVLHDISNLGSMEVAAMAGQHTMRQAWNDLANTREYRRTHILGRSAAVEGKARTLALENAQPLTPQGRGQGYTTSSWDRRWLGGQP